MSFSLILLAEILILLDVNRRIKFITSVHLIISYIILSQFVFYFGIYIVADPGPESRLTYIYDAEYGVIFYFLIVLITYSSTIFIQKSKVSVRDTISNIINSAVRFLPHVTFACTAFMIFQLIFIDYESLIFHDSYSSTGPRYSISFLTGVFKLYAIFSIVGAVTLPIAIAAKKSTFAILLTLTSVWEFLYSLSSSSRSAGAMTFTFFASLLLVWNKLKPIPIAVSTVIMFFVINAALKGRAGTSFGLLGLPEIVMGGLSIEKNDIFVIVANLFQGIFVTIDGLTVNTEFNEQYKILSFSPLPSPIDGFDSILRASEFRLGLYVPMSAISEAYLFGASYIAFLTFAYWIAIRSTLVSLIRGYASLALFMSLFLFTVFVQASAYPLRNTFRQLLLVIAVNTAVIGYRWMSESVKFKVKPQNPLNKRSAR